MGNERASLILNLFQTSGSFLVRLPAGIFHVSEAQQLHQVPHGRSVGTTGHRYQSGRNFRSLSTSGLLTSGLLTSGLLTSGLLTFG